MEKKQSEFNKVFSAWDILVIAFGAMIGWGWVVSSGGWIQKGGVLGAALGFVVGGVMIFFVGLTYAELTAAMPQCGGEHVWSHRAMGPTVWAAPRSLAPSTTMKAPFRCRPCVRTSTMALPRPLPPLVASALRFGSTRVRFSTAVRVWAVPSRLRSRHSSAASVAVAVMTVAAAVVTSTVASVAHPVRKEATANAAP